MAADLSQFNAAELGSIKHSLSGRAEDYVNTADLEVMWATKAYGQAEVHFNLLCAVDPMSLKLTKLDDEIYKKFREEFKDMKVDIVSEDHFKSKEEKDKWRPFCESFKGIVEDYNFASLLRIDCTEDYSDKNTTLAPRVQFLAIEIARNREGFNSRLKDKFRKKDQTHEGLKEAEQDSEKSGNDKNKET